MKVTFKQRRNEVVHKAPLLKDLLATFPSFHHYSQVYFIRSIHNISFLWLIAELGRILSKPNILISARDSWAPKLFLFLINYIIVKMLMI